MDVHCTTCGEPWDVYHLRHDAIFETSLCYTEAKAWTELSSQLKLLPRYREKFKATGFEFGGSIVNVMRCPACPKDAKPDPDKAALKAGIVEILGDDEDAIADAMEDCGVYNQNFQPSENATATIRIKPSSASSGNWHRILFAFGPGMSSTLTEDFAGWFASIIAVR